MKPTPMLWLLLPAVHALFKSQQEPLQAIPNDLPASNIPQSPDEWLFTTKFDNRVHFLLDHFKVPGVSIAVIDGDRTFSKVKGPSFTRIW